MTNIFKEQDIKFIVLIAMFLMTISLSIFISVKYSPKIVLTGSKKITLDYNEEYKEPGYKLIINNKEYRANVKKEGTVNTKKLGKYIIKYTYQKGIFKSYVKRIIYVKDLTKPVIILNGSKNTYICPDTNYKEDGYQAVDNYDGDITKNVKIVKNDDSYLYSVSDSSNNKTLLERKIIKKDIVNPTIKLNGSSVINLTIGEDYIEEGYIAIDNCDKDITNRVTTSSNILKSIGSYQVDYTVLDKMGNKTVITRTVNVIKKATPGIIYLTFDDGPKDSTTDKILDILKEENVHATFFVTNSGPDYLIKREFDEGHSIGLHSASHNYSLIYSSLINYFNDLKIVQDRVERITGYKSMIIRFPGGSSNTISKKYKLGIMQELSKEVIKKGYKYYDWNILSGDAGNTNTIEGVYNNVITNLSHEKTNIVLMHDIKPHTRDALKKIIEYAKKEGYLFDVITNETEMFTQKINN